MSESEHDVPIDENLDETEMSELSDEELEGVAGGWTGGGNGGGG